MKVVRLAALRTGSLYPPGNIPGVHLCYRLSRPQGQSATGRIMSMKNSNDSIGNRTRDLPACRAVPQPTYDFTQCTLFCAILTRTAMIQFCSKNAQDETRTFTRLFETVNILYTGDGERVRHDEVYKRIFRDSFYYQHAKNNRIGSPV